MKVGFTGAGGVGKTTTALILQPRTTLTFHSSVSRRVFTERGVTETSLLSMSPLEALDLQKAIFAAKVKQDEVATEGLFDRTLFDHVAYCFFRSNSVMPDDIANELLSMLRESMKEYDLLVYFPITFVPRPDGFRQTGEAYRYTIDWMIRGLLMQTGVKYEIAPDGTAEHRAQKILEMIAALDPTPVRID